MAVQEPPYRRHAEGFSAFGQHRLKLRQRDVWFRRYRVHNRGMKGLDPVRTPVAALAFGANRSFAAMLVHPPDRRRYPDPEPRRHSPATQSRRLSRNNSLPKIV
jgi:hypothetical protein